MKNIRKCLRAGFEVVSVGTDKKVERVIREGLKRFSEKELKKIRFGGVWKLNG